MSMTARQALSGTPDRGAAPFGAAPGDDSATPAELAAYALSEGRGYNRASVDAFRTKALNTVKYLEMVMANLRHEVEALRSRMTAPLSAESVSRGLAMLALEMRTQIGEQDPAVRQWYASELAAIVGANDKELAQDCAERLPALLKEALGETPPVRQATVEWMEQAFGVSEGDV